MANLDAGDYTRALEAHGNGWYEILVRTHGTQKQSPPTYPIGQIM